MRFIISGQDVLFDEADVMLLFNYRWTIVKRGRQRYAFSASNKMVSGKSVYMHQLIMPCSRPLVIDHINGNGLDNRRANLQPVLISENLRKAPPKNGKKYKGVYFRGGLKKPWIARLNTANRSLHLGYFATEVDAARAYNVAALKYFKDHRWLNIIGGA